MAILSPAHPHESVIPANDRRNGMEALRDVLEALSTALTSRRPFVDAVADLERSLGRALHPTVVEVHLGREVAPGLGVSIALDLEGETVATIVLRPTTVPISSDIVTALRRCASPLAAAIAFWGQYERRDASKSGPGRLDALCRVPNRLAFDERSLDIWQRCAQRGLPVTIALFDIDFFKYYNDEYGHLGGDGCLQRVAALLSEWRADDATFCARYGGEEFVTVFEAMSLDAAVPLVRRTLDRLASLDLEHAQTTLGRVSLSVGVAGTIPQPGSSPLALVAEADRALFRAKRLGRNRMCAGDIVTGGVTVARRSIHPRNGPIIDAPTFGREDDLARVFAALRQARVLTLVGSSGIGKSRLLGVLHAEVARRHDRAVVYVEPELLRSGPDPAHAIASAFDLTIETGDARGALIAFLDERDALFIVDHGDEPDEKTRALCEEITARTSGVTIVGAARGPLGITGERTIVVPPLDYEAAVELFTFLCGADGESSRDVIRAVGGNPAAIESLAFDELHLRSIDAPTRLF